MVPYNLILCRGFVSITQYGTRYGVAFVRMTGDDFENAQTLMVA